MFRITAAALGVLLLGLGTGIAIAHEGHDHGDQPVSAVPIAPRASSVSAELELVAVARNGVVTVFIDRFATNEPVTDATVEAETPEGPASLAASADGAYRLAAPWSTRPGLHDVLFTVTLGDATDVFPVTLDIHAPEEAAKPARVGLWFVPPAFAKGLSERLAARESWISGIAGFAIGGLVVGLLRRRRRGPSGAAVAVVALLLPSFPEAHEGHDHGKAGAGQGASAGSRDLAHRQPDGGVFVPKATQRILAIRTAVPVAGAHRLALELPGRVIADPNGSGFVQASVGGRLSPPPGGFPRLGAPVKAGDVLAYVTPPVQTVDASDMRQRQGELDQQIAIVERRVQRLEPLARSGVVATVQLDEARIELQGLRDRRAALDRIRQQPEPLVAPVAGVIAEANAVAGLMAQPSAVVFQIVDPARLWVEAMSFEPVGRLHDATARLAAGRSFRLRFEGAGLSDRNQAIPVRFAVEGDPAGLRIGQFVTVLASMEDERHGIALPRASVVRASNGQDLVYEHTGPEKFEGREIRVEHLDGSRVLVAAGLTEGKRIVIQGAELIDQVR